MLESIATILVSLIELYAAIGAVFAVFFVRRGAAVIDPRAAAGTLGFRLLIAPGAAALWPLLLHRWRRGSPPPEERNSHRDLASGRAGG